MFFLNVSGGGLRAVRSLVSRKTMLHYLFIIFNCLLSKRLLHSTYRYYYPNQQRQVWMLALINHTLSGERPFIFR